jgi:hypothetical protein
MSENFLNSVEVMVKITKENIYTLYLCRLLNFSLTSAMAQACSKPDFELKIAKGILTVYM